MTQSEDLEVERGARTRQRSECQEEILTDFQQLSRDGIRACLAYAAERERRTLVIPAA
jgi:uncharacterized protein (DUF433 family)